MKDESLTLEAETVGKTAGSQRLGRAFNHANMVKAVPVEGRQEVEHEARNRRGGMRAALGNFLKPTLSNFFLLGCLLGLFVLYCCSCVIHALTFPTRKKSS